MTEHFLRAVNLAGLMAALCYPGGRAVGLAAPLAALAVWLAASCAGVFLCERRRVRWAARARIVAVLGDIAVAYWAINWAALWRTELFIFALLPVMLLGLARGPMAAAAGGAAAAFLQALYARGSLWPSALALRAALLVFLPMAAAWQAEVLRAAAGRRARETVSFLRSRQISEFLSFVLYQLREYLVSVTSVAESLALSIPPGHAELAQRAERLRRLIGELNEKAGRMLGEKSEVTTGRVAASESFDLGDLAAEAVESARCAFAAAGVSLRLAREGGEFKAFTQRQGVRVALLALLQNALESCAAAGGGNVAVGLSRAGTRFELAVTDDAAGLDPAQAEAAFEPIYCARRGSGGLGLGLPMSRRIIERLGGSLQIRSRGGRTRASLILPVNWDLPKVRDSDSTWSSRRASV